MNGYSTQNIINVNALLKVRDFIELSQILERLTKHEEICDTENKLLCVDLERTIKGKPFIEFRTKRVEKLL